MSVTQATVASSVAICTAVFPPPTTMLGLKQSTVSYHLKQLPDAGIVQREKRGSFAYVSLTPSALERIGGLVSARAPSSAA